MATATWSTRIRHDSDPVYQEWRDELITKLGLMVTAGTLAADETNITPGAGARAGANAEAHYAVYHLDDSLHGSAPIYIRFGFGTLSGTTTPRLQVTVGTSTNGSGVLGGTALATIATMHSGATNAATSDTARNSYLCAHDGFFGLWLKQGGSTFEGFFAICRTCDGTGAITATGAIAVWGSTSIAAMTKTQAFRYAATAAAYTARTVVDETALGINPQIPTSTLVSSDIQVMMGWTITPTVSPIFGLCGVLEAEVAAGVSFSATLVGTSARTYIGLSTLGGPFGPGSVGTGKPKYAMLWE